MEDQKLARFLDALTELSRKHAIGLTGEPILFLMEKDDYDRVYSADAESKLAFV